jgi:phage gp36-like protein
VTYAVQQDLVDRFGNDELVELTNRAGGATIDATVVAKALADADDEINGYLATRYALPLVTVPLILKRLACDIARYFLYEDRATEIVTQRYKDAVSYLKGVSAGKASIGADSAGAEPSQSQGPKVDANDRTFSVGRPSAGTEGTLDDYNNPPA